MIKAQSVLFLGYYLISVRSFLSSGSITLGILSSNEQYSSSLIKTTYAEFIESAGAKVIPIPWDVSEDKFIVLLQSLNGVLLTGGGALLWDDSDPDLRKSSLFQLRIEAIYDFAVKMNSEGLIIHYMEFVKAWKL